MAVALLAAAGLQVRSFQNLVNADRGLDSTRVLLASVRLPATQFADKPSQAATAMLLEDRLRALPGIEKTTLASNVPPAGGNIHFGYDVQPLIEGAGTVRLGLMHGYYVAPAFFETFGIQLRDGRGFNTADDANAAVLSEALARTIFQGRPAVGESFSFDKQTYHVVGVAAEIRNSLTDPREDYPEFYTQWYRASEPGAAASVPGSSSIKVGLRCAGPCPSRDEVRQAIQSVSAALVLSDVHPLSDDFLKQLARPRVAAVVATAFSGLALLATAAGLYGVLAYFVSRRRREFGIRAALGAEPSALRLAVIGDGLRVTAAGVLLGMAAGWTLSRWLASVQFGVTFFDPTTWLAVVGTVAVIALVASWRPATSAMRVDPSEMLREP
jgi:ABC-type antimicrobial peptide transport system permease subunit